MSFKIRLSGVEFAFVTSIVFIGAAIQSSLNCYRHLMVFVVLFQIETEVPKYWAVVCKHTKYYWDNYWPVVHHYLVVIQELFLKYVPPLIQRLHEMLMTLATSIYELAPEFFDSIMAWFDKVGQSITEKIPDVIAVVQEYAIIASNLIVNLVNNAITWVQSLANR